MIYVALVFSIFAFCISVTFTIVALVAVAAFNKFKRDVMFVLESNDSPRVLKRLEALRRAH